MSIWFTLGLVAIIGAMNIICFFIGARTGQKVVKNEPIEVKTPVEIIKEKIEDRAVKREQQREQDIIDTIQHNIDIYDGTALGQKDMPR